MSIDLNEKYVLVKNLSRFVAFSTLLSQALCIAGVPNVKFQVNKNISLLYLSYLENSSEKEYKAVHDEIENSFNTIAADDLEKSEFVKNLCDIEKAKYRHKFMTPTFMTLWSKASEKYDSIFDSEFEVLSDRCVELQSYFDKLYSISKLDFSPVFDFYSSSLKKNTVFTIFVCPTQKNSGNYAKEFGTNIVLKFNYANKTADTCEILEQICHILYKRMILPNALQNFFYEHKSKNAYPAYVLLDNVLAYSIAKIWALETIPAPYDSAITKSEDKKILELAAKVLPALKKYLKARKKIDQEFVNEYINLIDQFYPDLYKDYNITMHSISLIVENGIDYTEACKIIQKQHGTQEITTTPGSHTTVFIGKNLGHPALRGLQDKLPKRDNDYMFIKLDKGKLYFVFKTNDLRKVKKALANLTEQPPLSKGITVNL
ncbi:MAG: hypothetical protein IJS10_03735 [Alphaproteobacteria bacterium]|nr:hypothetical protein [Alphaproteobacteria bacterium]